MKHPRAVMLLRRAWIPITLWAFVLIPPLGVLLYFRVARGMPGSIYLPLLLTWQALVIVPCAFLAPAWIRRVHKRIHAAAGMLCPNCLYDLRDTPDHPTCPECGLDLAEHPVPRTWEVAINGGKPFDPPAP